MDLSIKQAVGLLGGWSALLLAFVSWINKQITERLLSNLRREEAAALEGVKAQLANDRLLYETAIKGSQLGQDSTHLKRIEAADRVWGEVLQLRSKFASVTTFFKILLPEEYATSLHSNKSFGAVLQKVDVAWINEQLAEAMALESSRAYLGESLWVKFSIYRSLLGRLAVLISFGKEGKPIPDWRLDKGVKSLLSAVFSTSFIDSLAGDITALPKTEQALESMILEEISLIISGRVSAAESFARAKELKTALADISEITLSR